MLHFYGAPMSSSGRTRWMLEELEVPYEYHLTKVREGTRTPEFRAINPSGTVPAIDDDGFRMSESIAINFYLAEKYGPELMGKDALERARVYQWSLWAIVNLQPEVLTLMFDAMGRTQDPAALETARERTSSMLALLDKSLEGRDYLLGATLTVADVNTGSVVNIAHAIGKLGPEHPNAKAWMERLKARPAFTRASKA